MSAFCVSVFDAIRAADRIDGPDSFKGGLDTATYLRITKEARAAKSIGVARVTASRDLLELKNLGLLVQAGAGRATRYHVNLPGWGPQAEKDTAPTWVERFVFSGPSAGFTQTAKSPPANAWRCGPRRP